MADHESVQQVETAAAGKISELTEGVVRLLLQQRAEQAKQPPGDPELFRTAYRAYLERRVDRHTARNAAADIAIGLGSRDSTAIAMAEEQVLVNAQARAKEYRAVTATAGDPETPVAERLQAHARRKDIEKDLGIEGKPREVRAQTINGLDPDAKTKKELRTSYQETLEQNGASPQTAASASKDLTNQKGAADSLPIAQAHREIEQHTVLKNMYQGIYEKHGVSPKVASEAADQLARGNGANRSSEVRKAHNQALANIKSHQKVSSTQSPKPVAKENSTTHSPDSHRVSELVSDPAKRSSQTSPAQLSKPIVTERTLSPQEIWERYKNNMGSVLTSVGGDQVHEIRDETLANLAIEAGYNPKDVQTAIAQNSTAKGAQSHPQVYAKSKVQAAQLRVAWEASEVRKENIWMEYNSGENGVFDRLSNIDPTLQEESDIFTAQKALLAGHDLKDIQEAIADRSPYSMKLMEQTRSSTASKEYARKILALANASPEVKKKRESSTAHSTEMDRAPEKSSASVDVPKETSPSQQIWDKYSAGEQGVFETMAQGNPKMQQLSDRLIAKDALLSGEEPKAVQQAITQNSPYAKTLSRPGEYARRTVNKAELSSEVQEKRAQEGENQDNNRQVRLSRKEAQQRANQNGRGTSNAKPRKKVKAREKGMSY